MEITIPSDTTLEKFEPVALEQCLTKLQAIEKDETLTIDKLELITESGVILFKEIF